MQSHLPWLLALVFAARTDDPIYPDPPEGPAPLLDVEGADASVEADMGVYRERLPGSQVSFEMVPIPGGRFSMGSPPDEEDREDDEGPEHAVEISPFWLGRCEVTWDEYYEFMLKLDVARREGGAAQPQPSDPWADAVSRPTPPYVPMDFEMGVEGCPAVCMTQFAARQYTRWLSMKTGRFYRLPTEAEWEYACRAGTETAYSFGDDPDDLDEYAWYFDNADDAYHPVGSKRANPWGLYDMHGNVAEWVLDGHDASFYGSLAEAPDAVTRDPVAWPTKLYPRVVRGGSWDDDPELLRSAARRGSRKGWKVQDPQLPKSIWYLTDASFVGFRVARPLAESPELTRERVWGPDLDAVRRILEKQRTGGR
ncbi:MAG: formylglycine-generating enzyme family protein [Planctomycetota bacterium]|nr:formylglycine-generating enzyme family protein [Planctomycetota bacterium]MDP6764233.1 formylglycine-generating enzyme family protein [Planctomycetota bacterium]MDP6988387.1 formylglycine-generating enzyme family protein [Planctomycetota bacterium]